MQGSRRRLFHFPGDYLEDLLFAFLQEVAEAGQGEPIEPQDDGELDGGEEQVCHACGQ